MVKTRQSVCYRITDNFNDKWDRTTILQGITKNHGLFLTDCDEKTFVMISGEEGVFQIEVPEYPEGKWQVKRIMDNEVSDIFLFDIDNDGEKELITIEPFHSDSLVI